MGAHYVDYKFEADEDVRPYLLATFDFAEGPSLTGTRSDGYVATVRKLTDVGTAVSFTLDEAFGGSRTFTSGDILYVPFGVGGADLPVENSMLYGGTSWSWEIVLSNISAPVVCTDSTIFELRNKDASFNSPEQIAVRLAVLGPRLVASGCGPDDTNSYLVLQISDSVSQEGTSAGTFTTLMSVSFGASISGHVAMCCRNGIVSAYMDEVFMGSATLPNPAGGIGGRNILKFGGSSAAGVRPLVGTIESFRICSPCAYAGTPPIPTAQFTDSQNFERWDCVTGGVASTTTPEADHTVVQTAAGTAMTAVARCRIPRTGKYYFECAMSATTIVSDAFGICTDRNEFACARANAASTFISGGITAAAQVSWASAGRLMVACDWPNKKIWMGKDGSWWSSGDPAAGTNPYFSVLPAHDWLPYVIADNDAVNVLTATLRMASANLLHTVPAGFSLLV